MTFPTRLIQNYNTDVIVGNEYDGKNGTWSGNICVFFERDGLRFIYGGHGGDFYPKGIVCDSMCNIICANFLDSTIHVVSKDGKFVQYLFSCDTCIERPLSLALHKNALWIGSGTGEVRVYKYTCTK